MQIINSIDVTWRNFHFTANLQGYLIFMSRFALYIKNGTNCYGTFTYYWRKNKDQKSVNLLFYVMI